MVGVPDPLLLAVVPNGVPVALAILESYAVPVRGLPVLRSEAGAGVAPDPALAGRHVIVVDDGVDTGALAFAAAAALADSGVASAVLAVPVCSRESLATLQHRYAQVVALKKPFVRRNLAWHFADFDTIDEAEALRLLAALPSE
jgi:predicted phosphoribosyltransferase